jgi:hypothetical protein
VEVEDAKRRVKHPTVWEKHIERERRKKLGNSEGSILYQVFHFGRLAKDQCR